MAGLLRSFPAGGTFVWYSGCSRKVPLVEMVLRRPCCWNDTEGGHVCSLFLAHDFGLFHVRFVVVWRTTEANTGAKLEMLVIEMD